MPQSRFADPHTPVTDRCKAWTAITFREKISVLAKVVPEGSARAMQHVEDALPLGGGVRIIAGDGSMLGDAGVSGAPGGSLDEDCTRAGIVAVEDEIAF